MKFSVLTLVALAMSPLAATKDEYECETSRASPLVEHVNQLIDNMRNNQGRPNVCWNPADEGECTPTETDWSGEGGGAAFQLCNGSNGKQLYRCAAPQYPGLPVGQIPVYFEKLRDDCTEDYQGLRVGGRVILEDGGAELKLIRMPEF